MLESQDPTDLPLPPNSCICHVCYYYVQNAFTQQSLWVQWHLRLFLSENCGCSSLEIVTAHGTKWNLILLNLEERKTANPKCATFNYSCLTMSTFGAVWGLLFKNVLYTVKLTNPKQILYAV